MAKWVSSLFSDVRGKVADQVTFSIWKGRGYFRKYVKPANPRTAKQRAHRAVFKNLVKRYQELMADPDVKSAWNNRALERLISGFNLFVSWGRSSEISVSPESVTGGASTTVTITYKCGIPLSEARVYMFDGSTWTDITPAEGLSESGSFDYTFTPESGKEYTFWIASNAVLKSGDTSPQPYQAVTKWKPDETIPGAKEAKVTAT